MRENIYIYFYLFEPGLLTWLINFFSTLINSPKNFPFSFSLQLNKILSVYMLHIYYSFSRLWENRLIPPPSWRSNKRGVKLSQERNVECFGYMHRSGITRSYGNSSSYYFLNHCTYVHDGYSQYVRVPLYLHPCQPFFIH